MKVSRYILLPALLISLQVEGVSAAQEIGRIVAIRGQATIERDGKSISAQLKSGLQAQDTVKTSAASKAKILFVDDSVLTLAENSKLSVKEFIDGKGERGKSIFNLLDGKMRSAVGRTEFSVETPTAVAAARGTVIFFEVGRETGRPFTSVVCLEGNVEVRNLLADLASTVLLTPGTMVVVKAGEGMPQPSKAPSTVLEKARQATSSSSQTEEKKDEAGEEKKESKEKDEEGDAKKEEAQGESQGEEQAPAGGESSGEQSSTSEGGGGGTGDATESGSGNLSDATQEGGAEPTGLTGDTPTTSVDTETTGGADSLSNVQGEPAASDPVVVDAPLSGTPQPTTDSFVPISTGSAVAPPPIVQEALTEQRRPTRVEVNISIPRP